MNKSSLAAVLFAFATAGWIQERRRPSVALDESSMRLEHTLGQEAVLFVEAESEEELERIEVRRPDGSLLLDLEGTQRGLSGLSIEQREESLAALLENCVEGDYAIRAITTAGSLALGTAPLSFELPRAPRVVHPASGAVVSASNLVILWLTDSDAAGYRVQLEQGETDGLAVNLPPDRGSFRVPDGFLARGTETLLEIAAIGANGNRTVVEIPFVTQP